MTRDEAAALLDGCQYGDEGNKELFKEMRDNRLVAVFGASDDLTELRGAVYDELCVCEIKIGKDGLIPYPECDCIEARELHRLRSVGAALIEPKWDDPDTGAPWSYETKIPHSTFRVLEDDDLYCIGIVFSLDDCHT